MRKEITIESIGPTKAKQLLETNIEGQRNIVKAYVEKLAAQMAAGKWLLSNDAIVIQNGRLINGQHRLTAVILSGVRQIFLVLRLSDDSDLYAVLDSGKSRTVADVLKREEIGYCSRMAALTKLLLEYNKGLLTPLGMKFQKMPTAAEKNYDAILTRPEIVGYARKNAPELHSIIQTVSKLTDGRNFINRTIAGTFMEIARQKRDDGLLERAWKYLEAVILGGEVRSGAAYILRERLIKNATSKAKLPRSYILALFIKGFNFFCRGEEPVQLAIREGEPFPRL